MVGSISQLDGSQKGRKGEKKPFDLCLRLEGIFLASFNVLAYVLIKFFGEGQAIHIPLLSRSPTADALRQI